VVVLAAVAMAGTHAAQARGGEIEIYPRHFNLLLGERIHYTAMAIGEGGSREFLEKVSPFEFATSDASILALEGPDARFCARAPGRAEVIVRTADGRRAAFAITVAPRRQQEMKLAAAGDVPALAVEEVLTVVHANRDGFDHTEVARRGIDRLVRAAKERGSTVVYLVSTEYPNWYLADRRPDYAVASDDGRHAMRVDARRYVFAGGNFYWCLAANVRSVLEHLLEKPGPWRVELVFPMDAIYDGQPGKPYPAAMTTLAALFEGQVGAQAAYELLVVGFLKKLETSQRQGADQNSPFAERWRACGVTVRIGDDFTRRYRAGTTTRELVLVFVP
jgi:hypothetical protein